ncbi:MAG: hypothetical protein DRO40_08665 [Thermoprotei archaeon]|nr:MAG: hypothetical protein DRO40_08665 [Thermoprotei archaeon]
MAKLVVSTLGFEEKWAIRAVLTYGLEPGDHIIVITGPIIDKVERAYESIKKVADMVGDVKVNLLSIENPCDFIENISRIKEVLIKHAYSMDSIIIVLSGGMRVLVLSLYTAVLFLPEEIKGKINIIRLDLEDGSCSVEIPLKLLGLVETWSPGVLRDILKIVYERGEVSIEDIAGYTGKDRTTIRRQVAKLAELGLVELSGRPIMVRATELTRIYVEK